MIGVLKSVVALVIGSGAQLASNALAGFIATAWLPVSERGLMVLILSVTAILGILTASGLGNTLRAQLPRLAGADALAVKHSYAAGAATTLLLGALLSVAASVSLQIVDARMASTPIIAVVVLATVAQAATVLLTDARFAGSHFAAGSNWAALSAFAGVAGLICTGLLASAVDLQLSAVALLGSQYGAITLLLLVSVPSARRSGDLRFARAPWSSVRALIGAGIATMALPLAIVLITRADRLVLAGATTVSVVAVYGLAATYCEILRIVPTAIAQLAPGRIASGRGLPSVLRLGVLSVASSTFLGVLIFLVVSLVTVPLFGQEYEQAVHLTLLMLPGEIFYAIVVLGNLTLIGGGWSRASVIVSVVTTPISLFLYWWGASEGGVEGLAVMRNIVFLVMAVAVVVALGFSFKAIRKHGVRTSKGLWRR